MKNRKRKQTKHSKVFFDLFDKGSTLFFYFFLFLLPTQLGKHFFFDFSYISGVRVDYLSVVFYLIDIFIVSTIVLNTKKILKRLNKKTVFILIFLCVINIAFSFSKPLAAYKWLRIIEVFFLVYFIRDSSFRPRTILQVLLASTVLQFFIVVAQFLTKQSLQGVFYFLGERYFNLSTPGIAKASLQGVEILRPYGTFSHPNSMGGFYLLLYAFIISYKSFNRHIILKNVLILLTGLLVFLSFSKIAIFTYVFITVLHFLLLRKKALCRICVIARTLVLVVVSFVVFTAKSDPYTVDKRLALVKQSLSVIGSHPFFGVGLGNYLLAAAQIRVSFRDVFAQPVHNIFLLFISEFGFVTGLIILILNISPLRKFMSRYPLILLTIVITGAFDHYWYTLPQNMFLLAVVIGLLHSTRVLEIKET